MLTTSFSRSVNEPGTVVTAAFDLSPAFGIAPLGAYSQDRSLPQGELDTWVWKANGVIFSREQNPTYRFAEAGTYDIELAVEGPAGADTILRQEAIAVLSQPKPVRKLDVIRTGAIIGIGIGTG